MGILGRLKGTLRDGWTFGLGPWAFSLRVHRRSSADSVSHASMLADFNLRQAAYLGGKYPELARLELPLDRTNAADVLQCYLELIPSFETQADGVAVRNALHRLRNRTRDASLQEAATNGIAHSDMRDGIPDRAKRLLDDASLRDELLQALQASDRAYGAPLLTASWDQASRGGALRWYFGAHKQLLHNKRVLHISPETELRSWMEQARGDLGMTYHTSNLFGDDVDINVDLTDCPLERAYDLIICHRVLEHVLDDAAALRALHRMLRPGGTLQISVPQSMHQARTREWVVPDESHHEHVRHYGADFASRLEAAGFEVEVEDWLLTQPREALIANGAFPLRMYHANRAGI